MEGEHQLSSTMIDPENIEPIILFIGERNAAMGFKNINMKNRKKETYFIIELGCQEPKLRWSNGLLRQVGQGLSIDLAVILTVIYYKSVMQGERMWKMNVRMEEYSKTLILMQMDLRMK